jgi:hypothetical protein
MQTLQECKDLYEKALKWQKTRKQSAGHKAKKAQQKIKGGQVHKSDKELKRLSKISAKREIKDEISQLMFHKKFQDLNEDERKKVNTKVKANVYKQKIEKLTNKKFQERKVKQQEKKEQEEEKAKKEEEKKKKQAAKEKEKKEKEKEEKEEKE